MVAVSCVRVVALAWLKCIGGVCAGLPYSFLGIWVQHVSVTPLVISPPGNWTYDLSLDAQGFSLDRDSPLLSRIFWF